MGTTYGVNAPIEYGRPLHVDTVARRHPGLKMILAHLGHPWYEKCVAVICKQPHLYGEISGLSYRPWQYYNIMIAAQEYTITERGRLFWGTDFPFTKVDEAVEGLRNTNKPVEGTNLPRVSNETIERILNSNPFAHWWHGGLAL